MKKKDKNLLTVCGREDIVKNMSDKQDQQNYQEEGNEVQIHPHVPWSKRFGRFLLWFPKASWNGLLPVLGVTSAVYVFVLVFKDLLGHPAFTLSARHVAGWVGAFIYLIYLLLQAIDYWRHGQWRD